MTDVVAELPAREQAKPAAERLTLAGWARRIARSLIFRRLTVLVVLAVLWQIVALIQGNPIMLPTFLEAARAFVDASLHDGLLWSALGSLTMLLKGYLLALAIAVVMVSFAISNGFLRDTLQTVAAMLTPLPAVALLPPAMLWFGLGEKSLLFVLVNAVLWPFALAALQGFEGVAETHRLVGRNYGLKGPAYVWHILIPGALPSLISGMRSAWAFAWRTLIAAELVFGVSSSSGGLGWFIFQARNELLTDRVFAGLATVILIGLAVEAVVFRGLESVTVRRWGVLR